MNISNLNIKLNFLNNSTGLPEKFSKKTDGMMRDHLADNGRNDMLSDDAMLLTNNIIYLCRAIDEAM